METRWNVSGLYGTRNCTCVPISVAVRVWADSPRFLLGDGYASLVAWVGAGRRGKVVVGVVRLGWAGMVARGLKGSLTTGQPNNEGLPINPTKRVLRGFKGGNGQSPPNVAPTMPAPTSGNGLADPAVLLPLVQSLGLPEKVVELVRARVALPKTPKKKSREKELSLLRAKIDVLDQQTTRLNKSVLFHQDKLILRFEISRSRASKTSKKHKNEKITKKTQKSQHWIKKNIKKSIF